MAKKKSANEQPTLPMLEAEGDPATDLAASLGGLVAGLDEAGRGPLAGPVVSAAVVLPDPLPASLLALNDSKALSEAQREALLPHIEQHALAIGIGVADVDVIERDNILRASLGSMALALAACEAKLGGVVLGAIVDGNTKAPLPPRVVQRTVIGADAKCRAVMAASIVAKVTRDRQMRALHSTYPQYGFDAHKGYGTPQHLTALREHGPCPAHRASFAPVRAAAAQMASAQAGQADG